MSNVEYAVLSQYDDKTATPHAPSEAHARFFAETKVMPPVTAPPPPSGSPPPAITPALPSVDDQEKGHESGSSYSVGVHSGGGLKGDSKKPGRSSSSQSQKADDPLRLEVRSLQLL
jgi:hypothetical protein